MKIGIFDKINWLRYKDLHAQRLDIVFPMRSPF